MKKIIAVGNAGGNIADSIRKQGIGVRDAEFVYYDTDTESLYKHGKKEDTHILLPKEANAEEHFDASLNGVDTLIITAGLGGNTGSIYAPCIAWSSEDMNVENVIAFVSMPFTLEGEDKRAIAMESLENLKNLCDEVIVQENDKLDGELGITDMDAALCYKYAEMSKRQKSNQK